MFLPRLISLLLLFTSLFAHAQDPSLEAKVQQALTGKIFSLRTPNPADKIHYRADATPYGKPRHGLRSIDEVLKVHSVTLGKGVLTIRAERVLMKYDMTTGNLSRDPSGFPLVLTIDAPSPTGESLGTLLQKLFLTAAELDARACSKDETVAFQTWVSKTLQKTISAKKAHLPENAQLLCIPTGAKVYSVQKGDLRPTPIRTPDPEYDFSASVERVKGTVSFLLALGDDGIPIDALLIHGVDGRLNYQAISALRDWTFHPSTRDSKPIPVVIDVEVNFRLN